MPTRTLNLGILAHVDAGKTSLTERLLFDNGTIGRLGSVDAGTTQTDSTYLERQRGITIRSAVASFTAGGLRVNLIDTPGHPDFIAEVERALAVLDGAILVLSAVEGVQPQTRVLMKSLRRMRLPTLLFVNKIDRAGARYDSLLTDIRRKLAPSIVPMNSARELGTPAAWAVPWALDGQDARARAAEILADNDDALLVRLVAGSVPSRDELQLLLAGQTAAGLAHPVFFGSALSGQGAGELTQGIRTLLPPGNVATGSAGTRGTVFAIERGGGGEKIAYLRLFSGELRERQRVTFGRLEPGGRIGELTGQITRLEVIGGRESGSDARDSAASGNACAGRPRAARRLLTAGNIARLRGLPGIRVGDQLGETARRAAQAHFPPPSLETVVRPLHADHGSRLHAALMSFADEDPLIRARAAGGGATSVLLYGAVQKEVIAARLQAAGSRVYEPCHSFEAEIPGDMLSSVIGHLTALGADIARPAETGSSWLIAGEIPARLVQEFTMALPGLSRGEGSWWSHPGGDRPVRGQALTRMRSDGNPLNREEYLRFLADRTGHGG